MPWAEQRELEFIDDSTLLDELNYPCDTGYLKDPVWVVRHNAGHLVAAVTYDGHYGMYRFKYLTGGEIPKCLSGLFRVKEDLIKKAKKYLSSLPNTNESISFNKEALEKVIEPKEVEKTLEEIRELKRDPEALNKQKKEAAREAQKLERREKRKAEKKRKRTMFERID